MTELHFFDKTPIIDLFVSVQGEGSLTGIRSIFIRTSGCNLRCNFANSICDTPYSSFSPEKGKFTLDQIISLVQKEKATNIVLTGGEVCLYPDFIRWIKMTFPHHRLTLETNGTIFPNKEIARMVDLASISPKMLSSVDKSDSCRLTRERLIKTSPTSIAQWINYAKQTQLKYVVSCEEDMEEVLSHIKCIEAELEGVSLDSDAIYLMPAGSCFEDLCKTRPIVGKLANKYGFSISDRIQFNFFGSEREA